MIKCCKNCTERQVGCHGSCKRYQKEKAAHDALKEEEREIKEFNGQFVRMAREAIDKRSRNHRLYKGKKVGQK